MPCAKCNLNVSPNKRAICSTCSNDFHTACTNLKTLTNFNNSKDSWKCETCTSKLKNVVARKKLDGYLNNECSEKYNLDSVKIDLNIVLDKIESLSNNIKSIEKSIGFCSDSIDDLNVKLEEAVKKISDIENKMLRYEHKCNKLEKEVNILKAVINNNEQLMLSNKIEISGIPKTANENITEVVKTLAQSLKCDVQDCDIIDAFRGKAYKNMDGKIYTHLISKNIKELFVKNIKLRYKNNNPLLANEIHRNFPENKIFINDQLTSHNKKLLWFSKEVAKNYNYKYTWANMRGIFMRKGEGDQVIKIHNLETLQKMDQNKKISELWDSSSVDLK